jgi:prepilin-type N-terminal cleavage/methylation domain-containing protein
MASNNKVRAGVTLIEMMIVLLIITCLMVAVGATLVDAQNAWASMYKRSNSGPTMDGVIANREFEHTVRKSSKALYSIDTATTPQWLQVYYYKVPSDMGVTYYDGYSKFYYDSGNKELKVEEGDRSSGGTTSAVRTRTIAKNVTSCEFLVLGYALGMRFSMDSGQNTDIKDGNIKMTVVCSAERHNQ